MTEPTKAAAFIIPSQQGKSCILSMFYHFLANHNANRQFATLTIKDSVQMQLQGKCKAIYLDLSECNNEQFLKNMKRMLKELYLEHRYLTENIAMIPSDLKNFNNILTASIEDEHNWDVFENALSNLLEFISNDEKMKDSQYPIPYLLIDNYDAVPFNCFKHMEMFFARTLKDATSSY